MFFAFLLLSAKTNQNGMPDFCYCPENTSATFCSSFVTAIRNLTLLSVFDRWELMTDLSFIMISPVISINTSWFSWSARLRTSTSPFL